MEALRTVVYLTIALAIVVGAVFFACRAKSWNANRKPRLPQVELDTPLDNLDSKEDQRKTTLTYVDSEGTKRRYPVIVEIQGRGTVAYAKKNFDVFFYADETYDDKEDVEFPIGTASKWTMKANWIDGTMMRNIVSARIAADLNARYHLFPDSLNHGVIDGYPVEVYSKDGQYWGIYTWNIAINKRLWGGEQSDFLVLFTDEWTDEVAFSTHIQDFNAAAGFVVSEGEYTEQTIARFNEMIDFINDASDEAFREHLGDYIQIDSAINYLLMMHLINGIDNTNTNIALVSYDEGETYCLGLYDMDGTWGMDYNGYRMSYTFNPEKETAADITHDQMVNPLWGRIAHCFSKEVAGRWFELREDLFSREALLARFENFANSIGKRNYAKDVKRWGWHPGEDIKQIREYIAFKLPYLDMYFASMLDVAN